MFNDDEDPIAPASNEGKKVGGFSDVGKASVKPYYPKEAPLLPATTVRVLLDVSSSSSTAGRAALDLVVVLDVSGSMREFGRLDKLKSAMQFIIRKLTPMDRLSIVEFNGEATRLCPLRAVSEDAVPELTRIVEDLVARGGTNIEAGLAMGLQVLDGRRYRYISGRTAGVILMSDGEQNKGDATRVGNPREYPIYTLSLGAKADMNLLQKLAGGGGTYNPVLDSGGMSMVDVFSQLMAGLLTVVVRDLYVILSKPVAARPDDLDLDKIVKVDPGDFRQETDAQSGAVTVKFGDLFSSEVRKVVVELLLRGTDSSDYHAEILDVKVSYADEQGERTALEGQTLHVKRTSTAKADATTPELEAELLRRQHAQSIRAARLLADEKKLEDAKNRLKKAQSDLEGILQTNPMVAVLGTELQQLLDRMDSEELYKTEGRPYALAAELSHARQRFAAKGVGGLSLYTTPSMDAYLEQAKKFADDPSAPVPNADADPDPAPAPAPVAPTDPAPAPVAPTDPNNAPPPNADAAPAPNKVVYYMQVAMLLLQGIGNILHRIWQRLGYA